MESIRDILMKRDNMAYQDAESLIEEARNQFNEYLNEGDMESAYNICEEFFGLEPDYIHEFI